MRKIERDILSDLWETGLLFALVVIVLLLTSCGGPLIRKAPAHKPGSAMTTRTPSNILQNLKQSENPSAPASQTFSRAEERNETIPAGSAITSTVISTNGTNIERIILSAPLVRSYKLTETTGTEIGAAQLDQARGIWAKSIGAAEMVAAKLRGARPVQYLGFFLILCSLAMFHPAVKVATGGSTTLQMVTGGAGLALIFLPMIVVGNEILFIALGIGIPAVWFFVHRHGEARGKLNLLEK